MSLTRTQLQLRQAAELLPTLAVHDDSHICVSTGDTPEIDIHGCKPHGLAEAIATHADNGETVETSDDDYGNPKYASVECDGFVVTYYV